ncbi:MAG: hypothetical protein OEQ53_06395 [Saprospiraceae bacterium]|nr:hypothetical protein [Saprospiraceae bacterium]
MGDPSMGWFYLLLVCLPVLIVFAICYVLIKQFLNNRRDMELLAMQKETNGQTLPLRLKAYERLALLFERIDVPALIVRLKTKNMSSGDLQSAMMIAIQQEFEHNVTQQIYVSDKLWEIIKVAKQEIYNQMNQVMIEVAFTEDVDLYSNALIQHFSDHQMDPGKKALFAIKQEAKLHV